MKHELTARHAAFANSQKPMSDSCFLKKIGEL